MNKLTPIMSKLTLDVSKLIPVRNELQLTQQGNKSILRSFHFNGQTSQIALEVLPTQFAPGSIFPVLQIKHIVRSLFPGSSLYYTIQLTY
jgi:hypothetical protein